MCYFCHKLGKNPQAPPHRSSHCTDKANSHSKTPINKRYYENGKRLDQQAESSTTNSCVICWDEVKNMTFIPCGHVATCESCSTQVNDCPICRQPIVTKQKLFFS